MLNLKERIMPTPEGGIQVLAEWFEQNQHQPLYTCIQTALQRGFSIRQVHAAIDLCVIKWRSQ